MKITTTLVQKQKKTLLNSVSFVSSLVHLCGTRSTHAEENFIIVALNKNSSQTIICTFQEARMFSIRLSVRVVQLC